jgi:hypothetical protein
MEDVESNAKYIQDLLDGGSTPGEWERVCYCWPA